VEAERIAARFADRDDCIVEGPLSLDVAMDVAIAEEKHFTLILKTRAGSRLKITDETL